jgi:hypothetical protein
MIENLINYFKKSTQETKGETPKGLCPNCWGEQEYDKQIRDLYVDKQIDINNHEENHAFIQEFVVNRISGIQLKKGNNSFHCPRCKRVFKE